MATEYYGLIKRLRETSVDFGESDHVSVMMIEAADAIEELKQITTHYEEESKGWWLAACDAKEERERLKEQIPKWIPVTDRLPDDGAEVLAFGISGFSYVDWWIDGKWEVNSMVDGKYEFVTHWMPLPEPPKGEKE